MISIKSVVFFISYFIGIVGFLSVVRFVSLPVSLIFLLLFIFGVVNDRKDREILPRWLLNAVSLAVVLSLVFRFSLEDPVVPVVETLLILLGIKFLERKEFRDFMQIYTISVFLLAGSALLTIDISFMLFFTVMFFSVVVAVVLLTYYSQDKSLYIEKNTFKKLVSRVLFIPALALPFTAFLFVVLPRTQQPIFSFIPAGGKGATGFSDNVSIGDVSQIQETETVALRIKTDRQIPDDVYIRGVVLNFFDGKVWYRRIPAETAEAIQQIKNPVKQEVILEPTGSRYLLGLDLPVAVERIKSQKQEDAVFTANRRIFSRIKYTVVSDLGREIKSLYIDREFYTQIPPSLDERLWKLAESLKGESPEATVENVVKYLKDNYRYSLKNLSVSEDPLMDFLFEHRQGNCEYFASAAAVLLRMNNIPTRLVAGFKGVRYNQIGDYYMVPQKFAHTWIEVNIDGVWKRYDPTGSSSYELASRQETGFMERLSLFMDTIEYIYITSIIDFNLQKQVSAVKKAGSILNQVKEFFTGLKVYLLYVVGFAASLIIVILLVKFFSASPEKRLLKKFLKKMEKYGYKKRENEGLEEFAGRINDNQLRDKAFMFVREFESYYYRDKKIDRKTYRKLLTVLNNI
ncbi:transglutaminase family protein [Persephonella sp.]